MISALIRPQAARRSGSYSVSDPEAARLFDSPDTNAGVEVDEKEALTLPAVFRATDLMASHLAMLPLHVHQYVGENDRERRREHIVDHLLNREANPEMTAFSMRRAWHLNTMLWPNGCTEVERKRRGDVSYLWPIPSNSITVRRTRGLGGTLRYDVNRSDGSMAILDPADVCHVTGLSANGLEGLGLIRELARENVGLGIGLMRYVEAFFGNNMVLGLTLSTDQSMSKEDRASNVEEMKRGRQGPAKSWKPIILSGGLKPVDARQENEAAEVIAQMTFSVQDVSRWTGVVPPLLMDLSRGTFTNIKELGMWHVKFSLTPWFKVYEQELTRKLFTTAELAAGYFVEFNADGLLRGDPVLRGQFYRIMAEVAGATQNEIRALENWHSIEGGDKPSRPLNVAPLDGDQDGNQPPPRRRRRRSESVLRREIANAHRPLFQDVLSRMEAIEAKAEARARNKASHTKELPEWAETFYIDHAIRLRDALIPAVEALGGAMRATMPDTILDAEWAVFLGEFTKGFTENRIQISLARFNLTNPIDEQRFADPVGMFVWQLEERFGSAIQ